MVVKAALALTVLVVGPPNVGVVVYDAVHVALRLSAVAAVVHATEPVSTLQVLLAS
jgi:hypothetical protein